MKFISIMTIALLLAGIGSAQNYIPESTMEPGADLSMFSGDPGNIEMMGGNISNATKIHVGHQIWSASSQIVAGRGSQVSPDTEIVSSITGALVTAIVQPTWVITPIMGHIETAEGFQGFATGGTFRVRDRASFSGGNHSGVYSFVEGDGNGTGQLWGMATEVHDHIDNFSSARNMIGIEIALEKTNASSTISYGADIHAGGNQSATYPHTAGVRITQRWLDGAYEDAYWYDGLLIDRGVVARNINISNPHGAVGIDTSFGDFSTNDAIRMKYNQRLAYVSTENCYSMYNTSSSALEFVFPDTQKVIFRTSAGAIVGYVDATGFHNGAP